MQPSICIVYLIKYVFHSTRLVSCNDKWLNSSSNNRSNAGSAAADKENNNNRVGSKSSNQRGFTKNHRQQGTNNWRNWSRPSSSSSYDHDSYSGRSHSAYLSQRSYNREHHVPYYRNTSKHSSYYNRNDRSDSQYNAPSYYNSYDCQDNVPNYFNNVTGNRSESTNYTSMLYNTIGAFSGLNFHQINI